jgi:hypothetical protein
MTCRGRVDAFRSQNFGEHTVGVQIRREKGLKHTLPDIRSYLDAAFASIHSQGIAAKDVVIFVGTETPEVQLQVSGAYGSALLLQPCAPAMFALAHVVRDHSHLVDPLVCCSQSPCVCACSCA